MAERHRPSLYLPTPGGRRAVVVGAGSFGTAVAVLLARGGLRTTLQARTPEQARRLDAERSNERYLPGVELPRELRIEDVRAGLSRADFVFLGVPSRGLDEVIEGLVGRGLPSRAAVVSLAKGLVPPDGRAPSVLLSASFGEGRVGGGGGAHLRGGLAVRDGAGGAAGVADRPGGDRRPRRDRARAAEPHPAGGG